LKIVSLLPSATEIAFALGLGDEVEAVTDGCDHPAAAAGKPVVSRSKLGVVEGGSAAEIDGAVREAVKDGSPLYALDTELISEIQPDLILTQDLCRVCAVPTGDVEDALDVLGCHPEVLSLDPHTLEDVLADIVRVGEHTNHVDEARRVVDDLRTRIDAVEHVAHQLEPVAIFPLEWLEPPFSGGHWVPDLVARAGGAPVLCAPGEHSRPLRWQDVAAAAPDVVVFMPCGYDLEAAADEARGLAAVDELTDTPAWRDSRVWVVDATSYFSRPGPRIVDGLELLAWVLHPDDFPAPPSGRAARVTTDG
jgi:iron complex transport system substrate-binding protein